MGKPRHGLAAALAAALLAMASFAGSQPAPTNLRMQKVLREFTSRTGAQVIALGSWISGKGYANPLAGGSSDHDMRLLLPAGTDKATAIRQWRASRNELVALIKQEFKADAGKVLKSCNLYAPTQLMGGVETATEAMDRFRSIGQVPALAYTGRVNQGTSARLAEGLYGSGASAWTQKYEKDAGRLFYSINGRSYVGMTDLTHLEEGLGTYSIAGMSSTSRQWIEHAEEALAAGNGKSLAKYLNRLDRDLAKAKDLARCDLQQGFRDEIRALASELAQNPRAAARLEGKIHQALQRAGLESAILARLTGAGPVRAALLKTLMGGTGAAARLKEALVAAVRKVPADKLLTGIFAYLSAKEISGALAEGKEGDALAAAASYLLPLGPALLASIANSAIEASKESGYALAASGQDPWDLLEGIYGARGREGVDPQGRMTLDDLVNRYWDEKKVDAIIWTKANWASRREAGNTTGKVDKAVAQAIYDRCAPVILGAWRAKRELLYEELLKLVQATSRTDLAMSYAPSPAPILRSGQAVSVSVVAEWSDRTISEKIDRMRDILDILVGKRRSYARTHDEWTPNNPSGNESTCAVSFDTAGVHSVAVERTFTIGGAGIAGGSLLDIHFTRKGSVDVEVKAAAEPAKPKPTAVPAPSRPTARGGHWVLTQVGTKRDVWEPAGIKSLEVTSGLVTSTVYGGGGKEFTGKHQWSLPPGTLTPGQKFDVTAAVTGTGGSLYIGTRRVSTWAPNEDRATVPFEMPTNSYGPWSLRINVTFGSKYSVSVYYEYTWVGAGQPEPPNAVNPDGTPRR